MYTHFKGTFLIEKCLTFIRLHYLITVKLSPIYLTERVSACGSLLMSTWLVINERVSACGWLLMSAWLVINERVSACGWLMSAWMVINERVSAFGW